MLFNSKKNHVLPGFSLAMGMTIAYLSLIVLLPLASIFVKTATLTLDQFWHVITTPRVLASFRLSFGAALIAASINVVFGLLLAWCLVRYRFVGRRLVDALIDLPEFVALAEAIAGGINGLPPSGQRKAVDYAKASAKPVNKAGVSAGKIT